MKQKSWDFGHNFAQMWAKKQFGTEMAIIAKKKRKISFFEISRQTFFLQHLSPVMTKTLDFLFQDTLELFKTEKIFKLTQNYDLQPYLKFLQKKFKNWFFAFFFVIFCKIFIFIRKIHFFLFSRVFIRFWR